MTPRPVAAVLAAAGCALYWVLLRRRVLTWGATQTEAASRLPGDELLEQADGVSTRAIEIHARAADVWPSACPDGPVSPRWPIHVRLDREPARRQHAQRRQGSCRSFSIQRWMIGFGSNRMRLERFEPEHVVSWRSENGNWVWTFVLDERDARTRLISRDRFRLPMAVARIGMLPMEPASLVTERKMLQGIKQRAEQLTTQASRSARVASPWPLAIRAGHAQLRLGIAC